MRDCSRRGGGLAAGLACVVLTACTATTEAQPPVSGGTLHYLSSEPAFSHLDPQRMYLPEDVAFAAAYLHRTLTAYTSPEEPAAVELAADLATDTGTARNHATEWSFTLREGAVFEDGSPIGCAAVKFGVSRAFDPQFVMQSGMSRAVRMLDVATVDGVPVYSGPYAADPGDVAAFDRAVSCSADDRTITFRLAEPAGDFNHAVSSLAFAPVPVGTPAGDAYDTAPVSSGPYRIETYTPGTGLTLARNEHWDRDADPLRPAHPDRVEVALGLEPDVVEARLLTDEGDDRTAVAAAELDTRTAERIAADDDLAGRTVGGPAPGVRYLAINTELVPVLEHRQAIAAAVDRSALHDALGGDPTGTLADSLLTPLLAGNDDPPPSSEPASGDPDRARDLIAAAGAPMPALTFAYEDTPANREVAEVLTTVLRAAGIALEPVPLGPAEYYPAIRDPASPHALMLGSWAPAWADGSTVVTDLLTPAGGPANLSRYDVAAVTAAAEAAAAELDPAERAEQWAAIGARAVADAAVVPIRFDRHQRLVGSLVGGARGWAPYGSVAHAALWVRPEE
ncbi:ABC transporter substrate-binding protein [Jiangella asiatica]|uniref:ABC transporter substrate-binding protein n=1 Tax=Jiangella asiatica TaxID=2530372 RepID=UPI00104A94F0|nr:ABC transporter substrate-binding protein [Jiangella asiatica]